MMDGMSIFLLVTWNISLDKTAAINTSLRMLIYLIGATKDFVIAKHKESWHLVKTIPSFGIYDFPRCTEDSFRAIFHQSNLIITIALHYWGDRIPAWCMYFISLFNYNYCFLTRVSMEVRRIRMMLTKVYADFSVSSVLFVNIPFFLFCILTKLLYGGILTWLSIASISCMNTTSSFLNLTN